MNSPFSNSGYGYDNAGRLTGARQDSTTGCAIRDYKLDTNSNRTALTTYGPDSGGNCQDSNPATTRTWTYDTADRTTNSGYAYDTLGRALTLPDDDTLLGDGAGDITNTFYTNDLARTISQGTTTTTYTLDVALNRYRAYDTNTAGTTVNHTNHYTGDSDKPAWIADGTWYTRTIQGLDGMAALYTGAAGHLEWQIINLRGDVVGMRLAGSSGLSATYVADEYGRRLGTDSRYGWLGNAQRSTDNPGALVTMGVRLYNPMTGRFLSPDRVYGGNANSYDYCYADSVNCTDLNGLWSKTFSKKITYSAATIEKMFKGSNAAAVVSKVVSALAGWLPNEYAAMALTAISYALDALELAFTIAKATGLGLWVKLSVTVGAAAWYKRPKVTSRSLTWGFI